MDFRELTSNLTLSERLPSIPAGFTTLSTDRFSPGCQKKILQCRLYFSWTRCGVQYNIKKCSLIELESLGLLLNCQGTFSGEYDVVFKFEVERAKVAGKQVKS